MAFYSRRKKTPKAILRGLVYEFIPMDDKPESDSDQSCFALIAACAAASLAIGTLNGEHDT